MAKVNKDQADLAVDEILKDLTDRRGLSHEWYNIDLDIQEEIRKTWAEIIMKTVEIAND